MMKQYLLPCNAPSKIAWQYCDERQRSSQNPELQTPNTTLYTLPRLTVNFSFATKIPGLKNFELPKALGLKNIKLAFTSALVLPLPPTASLLHLRGHSHAFYTFHLPEHRLK